MHFWTRGWGNKKTQCMKWRQKKNWSEIQCFYHYLHCYFMRCTYLTVCCNSSYTNILFYVNRIKNPLSLSFYMYTIYGHIYEVNRIEHITVYSLLYIRVSHIHSKRKSFQLNFLKKYHLAMKGSKCNILFYYSLDICCCCCCCKLMFNS